MGAGGDGLQTPPAGMKPADQRFYGRRKGRPLSPSLQMLVSANLPALRYDGSRVPNDQFQPKNRDSENRDIFLEIGFGGGEHLAALAAARPDAGFIGAEPFINGVATLVRHIDAHGLQNVRIWDDDVRLILDGVPTAGLAGAYVMFPDPWPKRRHAARRILNPVMMDVLARVIRPHGFLMLASDDPTAKSWLLQAATSHHGFIWTASRPDDWRQRPDDIPETRYMRKALKENRKPSWFRFKRNI